MNAKAIFEKDIEVANQGDAREESYYATLKALLKKSAESFGKKNIHNPILKSVFCVL